MDSTLRLPFTSMLGSVAHVRTLRELSRHGGELSAPSLTLRTKLSKRAVQLSLQALETMQIVEGLGSARSRLYRLQRNHPLAPAVAALFRAEEERFDAVLDAIRSAAQRGGERVLAVWLYGSVARGQDRPDSDLDVAVVADAADPSALISTFREALQDAETKLAFSASAVALGCEDVIRLAAERDGWWAEVVRDALAVVGDPPDVLLRRLMRREHGPRAAAR